MQKRKGISLIVLVITIIVMTILAGAIILTLNNSGIINKATDAVEQTNLATLKELTQMAWAEAYATGERTEEGLKAAVDKALEDNKVDTTKYEIEVTTSGVTVELKGEAKVKWIQQGLTVTNGTVTLEIGDSVAYDETKGGTITGLTATDWKVLGASEQGELLIMSTIDLDDLLLGDDLGDDLEKAQSDWLNGPDILDGLCEPYGKGEGATGARSITVEDVDKITGYDKTTYGKGSLYEYGNEVTFSYNGTTSPVYVGSNGATGILESVTHDNGFYYYSGKEFVHVNDLTTGTSGAIFATIKRNTYGYWALELETMETTSKAFIMLFGKYIEEEGDFDTYTDYWLASQSVGMDGVWAMFYMRSVEYGSVSDTTLLYSDGGINGAVRGVRAVVALSPDIQLTGSSDTGWSF